MSFKESDEPDSAGGLGNGFREEPTIGDEKILLPGGGDQWIRQEEFISIRHPVGVGVLKRKTTPRTKRKPQKKTS